ncbi:MAG: (deoxy)nucleoside triphosphate pyrophosphohydrolase [Planctomycetota bacterium]
MSTSAVKRIGIAVVEHAGRYLVGIRGPDVPLGGCAEFPGGKCLPNESPEDCAVRECREESGLLVTVDRLLLRCEHSYPHATVDLHFVLCRPTAAASVSDEHRGFRWVPHEQLASLKFPEANEPLIQMLTDKAS